MRLPEPSLSAPVIYGRPIGPVDSTVGSVDSTAQSHLYGCWKSKGCEVIPWTLPAYFNKKIN